MEENTLNKYNLFPSSEESLQVATELNSIGCCPRCILRFLGESSPLSYRCQQQDIETELKSAGVQINDESNTSPCPACLGILQKYADKEFILTIVSKVNEDGFSFTDYQCSLMIPVCLLVREKSIYIHLCKKFGTVYSGKEDRIASAKDVWKWSCGPILSDLLDARFQNRSGFDVRLVFDYSASEKELSFLLDLDPDTYRGRKHQRKYGFETFTRSNVGKSLSGMSDKKFENCYHCPASKSVTECTCDISCCHEAIFIAGRYQKYSRVLSQTPWIVNGERLYEGSVEDFICDPMREMFKPTENKLSSSGREDVDVRMLGTGRPFVIELVNPHCAHQTRENVKKLQQTINESTKVIQVRDLQIVSREDLSNLKDGETEKTKSYSATCWCERKLTQDDCKLLEETKNLTILQKTPIRVLHRRAAMTRDRVIFSMQVDILEENTFKLYLETQAGTYIKEFVHGDFGRTSPNLCEILKADCDIINLDVEAVNVDWPPYIDERPASNNPSDTAKQPVPSTQAFLDSSIKSQIANDTNIETVEADTSTEVNPGT